MSINSKVLQKKDAVPILEWLLDPIAHRGSGRTTIMAIAFINLAMRYPGQRIDIFDHYDGKRTPRRSPILDGILRVMAAAAPTGRLHINDREMFIVYEVDYGTPNALRIVGMDESSGIDWTGVVNRKPSKKTGTRKISHVRE